MDETVASAKEDLDGQDGCVRQGGSKARAMRKTPVSLVESVGNRVATGAPARIRVLGASRQGLEKPRGQKPRFRLYWLWWRADLVHGWTTTASRASSTRIRATWSFRLATAVPRAEGRVAGSTKMGRHPLFAALSTA